MRLSRYRSKSSKTFLINSLSRFLFKNSSRVSSRLFSTYIPSIWEFGSGLVGLVLRAASLGKSAGETRWTTPGLRISYIYLRI